MTVTAIDITTHSTMVPISLSCMTPPRGYLFARYRVQPRDSSAVKQRYTCLSVHDKPFVRHAFVPRPERSIFAYDKCQRAVRDYTGFTRRTNRFSRVSFRSPRLTICLFVYLFIYRFQDRPTSSNGYIAADRLYDLNPMPSLTMITSSASSHSLKPLSSDVGLPARNGGDPATLLQYSATYGNPYLRSNSAQWQQQQQPPVQKYDVYGRPEPPPYSAVKNKRKTVAGAGTAPAGPNYHIGVAKRQTLATHVWRPPRSSDTGEQRLMHKLQCCTDRLLLLTRSAPTTRRSRTAQQ